MPADNLAQQGARSSVGMISCPQMTWFLVVPGHWSIMVRVMACCLLGARPLHEAMLDICQSYPYQRTEFRTKNDKVSFSKVKIILNMSRA